MQRTAAGAASTAPVNTTASATSAAVAASRWPSAYHGNLQPDPARPVVHGKSQNPRSRVEAGQQDRPCHAGPRQRPFTIPSTMADCSARLLFLPISERNCRQDLAVPGKCDEALGIPPRLQEPASMPHAD